MKRFQQQVVLLDRIGLTDPDEIMKIVRRYKDQGEVYPDEPFVVTSQKKKRSTLAVPLSGDMVISEEFVMDASAGVICQTKDF